MVLRRNQEPQCTHEHHQSDSPVRYLVLTQRGNPKNSQRLQRVYPKVTGKSTGHERNNGGTRLTESGNPACMWISDLSRLTEVLLPMEPVKRRRGRILPSWFMQMGYIGPKSIPTSETATAFPMSDGTNQTVNSRLGCYI